MAMVSVFAGVQAGGNRFRQNPANHYITVSIGGGEGNTLSKFSIEESKDLIGADALFGIGYEIRKNNFIFNLGVQADFDYTRQQLGDFTESERRSHDFENDAHTYNYRYSQYTDLQRNMQVAVPIGIGMYFPNRLYGIIGAKFVYSIWNDHSASALMSTDGQYDRYFQPITDMPEYGFYPQDTYTYSGSATQEMKVGPTLEFGVRLPVYSRSHRIGIRAGLYAEYLIPLVFGDYSSKQVSLVDYSGVDKETYPQNQQQLKESIVFNSALNSTYLQHAAQNFSVGVKFTFLFNVTPVQHICNCENDLGIRPVRTTSNRGRILK